MAMMFKFCHRNPPGTTLPPPKKNIPPRSQLLSLNKYSSLIVLRFLRRFCCLRRGCPALDQDSRRVAYQTKTFALNSDVSIVWKFSIWSENNLRGSANCHSRIILKWNTPRESQTERCQTIQVPLYRWPCLYRPCQKWEWRIGNSGPTVVNQGRKYFDLWPHRSQVERGERFWVTLLGRKIVTQHCFFADFFLRHCKVARRFMTWGDSFFLRVLLVTVVMLLKRVVTRWVTRVLVNQLSIILAQFGGRAGIKFRQGDCVDGERKGLLYFGRNPP